MPGTPDKLDVLAERPFALGQPLWHPADVRITTTRRIRPRTKASPVRVIWLAVGECCLGARRRVLFGSRRECCLGAVGECCLGAVGECCLGAVARGVFPGRGR